MAQVHVPGNQDGLSGYGKHKDGDILIRRLGIFLQDISDFSYFGRRQWFNM
jgi:hypothetical protein